MKRIRDIQWKADDRGDGTIFFFVNPETREKVAPSLYLSYRAEGKEILVSAKTDDLDDARRELKRLVRNRDNAKDGKEPIQLPKAERLTVAELLDAILLTAEESRLASLGQIRSRVKTLKAAMGSVRVVQFKYEHSRAYIARRGTQVKPATVRRELEILRSAFLTAQAKGRIAFAPYVDLPAVDNISEAEFPPERLGDLLGDLAKRDEPLRDLVEFISLTARRPEGLRKLRWNHFNEKTWTLRIPPEKRGNEVTIGLDGDLRAVIQRRSAARQLGCDLIFHRKGKRMGEDKDRRLFKSALEALKLPYGRSHGLTIYSVKSTAVGEMFAAGLSAPEIKDRSGHKTDKMLERYRKQNDDRAHATSQKFEAYWAARKATLAEKAARDAANKPVITGVFVK